jgi:threonine dehydrogenase-like Zn-dependent dehydrogenase
VGKDLTVVTCTSAPLLWDKGIRLVQSGKVNVRDIVTRRVLFADAEIVIDTILQGKSSTTKTMITY